MSALPADCKDRAFWLAVRQGLLAIVRAIETRYLPDVAARKKFPSGS